MINKQKVNEMSAAYYKQALDIMNSDRDWKQVCLEIAKRHPKALCDAVNEKPWEYVAKIEYEARGKIAAIKYIRSQTGMPLKDAKEIADSYEQ